MMQGFLTAVRQEVNRRHAADKWALDDIVLTSEVIHPAKDVDGIKDPPNEGVFVYGMHIDGCSWSGKDNRLVDSEPRRLYYPLPVMHVTGVQVRCAGRLLCCNDEYDLNSSLLPSSKCPRHYKRPHSYPGSILFGFSIKLRI